MIVKAAEEVAVLLMYMLLEVRTDLLLLSEQLI